MNSATSFKCALGIAHNHKLKKVYGEYGGRVAVGLFFFWLIYKFYEKTMKVGLLIILYYIWLNDSIWILFLLKWYCSIAITKFYNKDMFLNCIYVVKDILSTRYIQAKFLFKKCCKNSKNSIYSNHITLFKTWKNKTPYYVYLAEIKFKKLNFLFLI